MQKRSNLNSLNEEIRKAINYLHERESGNYESLIKQIEPRVVNLNAPQLVAALSRVKVLALEWARGTGKTTFAGYRYKAIVESMPRSTGLLVGLTYQDVLTRILPSLVQGLEMFGLYKDLHYFVGKRPPRAWRRSWGSAYQPPEKFNRYITFWNGAGIHLISQEVKGDGRGLNADWLHADESVKLNGTKIADDVVPTLRGTHKGFNGNYLFGSELYSSSTALTPEGQWFLDLEQKAKADPWLVNFISATSAHNKHNLREGYMEEERKKAYVLWKFEAEYENKRPTFSVNSFYYLLDERIHAYIGDYNYEFYDTIGKQPDCRGDNDLVKGHPLTLGIDWGAAINSMSVNQNLRSINEYRTLKEFYVLGEEKKSQDDLFAAFNKYYQYHDCRDLYLWYDNSGNHETGIIPLTRAEKARDQLVAMGWNPILYTTGGSNISHHAKFMLWENILKEDSYTLPKYRINKSNCPNLWLSMRNAKTKKDHNGIVHKDKSSETSTKIPRQQATDLSDANDTPIWGLFSNCSSYSGTALPDTATFRK